MIKQGYFLTGILILCSGVLVVFWPGSARTSVELIVSSGDSGHQIARKLVAEGHLLTKYPFLGWVRLRGAGTKVKLGRYVFGNGRSAYWIVDDLIHGRTQKIRAPIPEGFSTWQIAERLDLFHVCAADEFKRQAQEQRLEGYLFPATYEFDYGIGAEAVIRIMKSQFERVWNSDFDTRARELKWTQHQVLTLASIIEREIMVRAEMPLVSAVYHNRLRKGMKLEADPTVQYALGFWKKRLLFSDLKQTDSPYNTYKYKGLPPGPICSPGRDAILAALYPADSNALFFVAREDGTHTFSHTYAEHLKKVRQRNRNRRKKR